ncbi:TIM barrel protein [Puniceicoccaceae bacterium K14]|nr:TIM barrel protein [Puniceicoccaceae bacterium K14]
MIQRRTALKTIAAGAATIVTTGPLTHGLSQTPSMPQLLKGNVRHSVCKWCYKHQSLEELAQAAQRIGLEAIDLVNVDDYPTLDKYGLKAAITWGVPGGITNGLNRVENHDAIIAYFEETLPLAAKGGSPNVICFSGNRDGMDDEQGLENCAIALKRIAPLAEKHGVTVIMELLNSKRNHPDYMCDHTSWGVELCDRVGSDRFKLLYDIYHMQIMEGDVIDTIREFHPYFAHYHTGGVPGRNEIDETQELNYPAIIQAIVDTGYKGYIAQEFIPAKQDALGSLEQAIRICDV